jgi:MoaA/NifB/PqqE/SkfB family radical SAM enzyme
MMNNIIPFEKIQVFNIETTSYCNLKCVSCIDKHTRPQGFISEQLFDKVVSQCSGKEVRLFMSGEPLLHPKIDSLIKISRKYTNKTVTHTNATRLNCEMSYKLIDAGLNHLSISFDGLDQFEYENNRKGSNFNLVSNNINNFIAINDGKIYLTIQRIIEYGKNKENLSKLFPGANAYPVIYRHSWDVKDSISGHKPEKIYDEICYFPFNYMSILWDGRVNLCCADLNGRCIIGDANIDNLKDIWNGEIMKSIRQRMIDKQSIPEICSGCERYRH